MTEGMFINVVERFTLNGTLMKKIVSKNGSKLKKHWKKTIKSGNGAIKGQCFCKDCRAV